MGIRSDYYNLLEAQECRHIQETVTIKKTLGKEAQKIFDQEISERSAEKQRLIKSVRVKYGRAADIDYFVDYCHRIVEEPHSPIALGAALYEIVETVSARRYPRKDRQKIIDTFTYLINHGDAYLHGLESQIYSYRHKLQNQT